VEVQVPNDNKPGPGGDEPRDEQVIEFLGLRLNQDDLVTIAIAVSLSYGIRW
jgi:hypothetical protein